MSYPDVEKLRARIVELERQRDLALAGEQEKALTLLANESRWAEVEVGQDAEIAALTERFVPLVEENERLHAELASARTVERKDLHEQIERLLDAVGNITDPLHILDADDMRRIARAALSQPAATGEGTP